MDQLGQVLKIATSSVQKNIEMLKHQFHFSFPVESKNVFITLND